MSDFEFDIPKNDYPRSRHHPVHVDPTGLDRNTLYTSYLEFSSGETRTDFLVLDKNHGFRGMDSGRYAMHEFAPKKGESEDTEFWTLFRYGFYMGRVLTEEEAIQFCIDDNYHVISQEGLF